MFEQRSSRLGHASNGGYASQGSLAANIAKLAKSLSTDGSGRLGSRGKNKVRLIVAKNPSKAAKEVFSALKVGGTESKLENGKGQKAVFKDGSRVVFRPVSSSDGSPAVEIIVTQPNRVSYKIHFVSRSKK